MCIRDSIKTNYTSQLDLELSAFNINQTSVITYTDPDSGNVKELTALGKMCIRDRCTPSAPPSAPRSPTHSATRPNSG